MKYLTIEQRETLQKALEGRTEVLRAEIEGALREAGSAEAAHLANHYEEVGRSDVSDAALADLEASLDVAALERDIRELVQTRDTLRRLHTLEYGTCTDCGAELPFTRLLA